MTESNTIERQQYIYIYIYTGAQSGFFRGRGGFLGWGHVGKCFMCDTKKEAPQGKNLAFFLHDAFKIVF